MDIFRDYKRDRRDVMGQCQMKGEEYENEKKRKQELFITSMRYYVFGAAELTRKEIKLLKDSGIIKRRLSRFPQMNQVPGIPEDSNEEDNADLLESARMYLATKASEPEIDNK